MNYLDLLDEMLGDGLRVLGEKFPQAQLAYVLGKQQADGGFGGRRGASDVYYTEFALRLIMLLAPDGDPVGRADTPSLKPGEPVTKCAAECLAGEPCPMSEGHVQDTPRLVSEALQCAAAFLHKRSSLHELVDVFSTLNARRLLAKHEVSLDVDQGACRDEIDSRRARRGGYGRPDGSGPTAYATFLAALSLALLGEELPRAEQATAAIAALQQLDGGFAQEPGGTSQTMSTAAALAFLLMENAFNEQQRQGAISYLVARQNASGGFSSHEQDASSDLLATFTALSTLAFVDELKEVDCAALARFVRSCAAAEGGFGAHPGDPETDVEYTYYGVGALALLGLIAS